MRDAGTQVSLLDVTVSVIDTGTQSLETRLLAVAVIRCFRSRGWNATSIPCPEATAYLLEYQEFLNEALETHEIIFYLAAFTISK